MSGLYIAWAVLTFVAGLIRVSRRPVMSSSEFVSFTVGHAAEMFLLVYAAVLL